jgi:hypothetical protein
MERVRTALGVGGIAVVLALVMDWVGFGLTLTLYDHDNWYTASLLAQGLVAALAAATIHEAYQDDSKPLDKGFLYGAASAVVILALITAYFGSGGAKNIQCGDFLYRGDAQAFHQHVEWIRNQHLDLDRDGKACELLPRDADELDRQENP